MIYAPVLIITLCRYEELKRCIASLKRNPYACKTELYIGVDFPLRDSHKEGYRKIVQYLEEGVEGFAQVHILKQSENQGWFQNFVSVRDEAYLTYDRFIYLEDDVEVSANFLEYMDKNLDYFEKDRSIQAICGYSYPFTWKKDRNNVVKINTYFTAWGYGTWREKEAEMYQAITLRNFDRIVHQTGNMRKLYKASRNQFCNFVKGMLEYIPVLVQKDEIVKLDMSFSIYIFMHHKYVIFPDVSKTRNIGCNGQGMNCGKVQIDPHRPVTADNYDYALQEIDSNLSYELCVEEKLSFWEENNRILEWFYPVGKKERMRTILAYLIYLVLGREKTKRLLQ